MLLIYYDFVLNLVPTWSSIVRLSCLECIFFFIVQSFLIDMYCALGKYNVIEYYNITQKNELYFRQCICIILFSCHWTHYSTIKDKLWMDNLTCTYIVISHALSINAYWKGRSYFVPSETKITAPIQAWLNPFSPPW